METRKPDLTVPIPDKGKGDALGSPSVRSPRFREDFDAPFSEALMNASRTTLATDTLSYPSNLTNSRTSFDAESPRRTSFSAKRPTNILSQSTLPFREHSWESETQRRMTVNDRILEWAKKSWGAVRLRSATKGDGVDAAASRSTTTSPTPDDVAPSEMDGLEPEPGPSFSQAVVTVAEVQKPKAA